MTKAESCLPCDQEESGEQGAYRIPLLGEVISVMDEEVTAVHVDEGPHAEVLRPVALLPLQLLACAGDVEILHDGMTSRVLGLDGA